MQRTSAHERLRLAVGRRALALLFAIVIACSSGGDVAEPVPTSHAATATAGAPTPAAPGTVTGTRSRPAVIDLLIAAMERGDALAAANLVALARLPCGPQQGPGSLPACGGEPLGTLVEVFPFASCEGEVRPAAVLEPTLASFVQARLRLHGVYALRPDQLRPLAIVAIDGRERPLPRAAEQLVVFAATTPDATPRALAAVVAGGLMVGFITGCNVAADALVPAGAQSLPAS